MLDIQFGMVPIESSIKCEVAPKCADELCGRHIMPGEECFVDTLDKGKVYCDSCGKCLRYSRKKEAERQQMELSEDGV